jgi:hypothetical protein
VLTSPNNFYAPFAPGRCYAAGTGEWIL